MAEKTVTRTRSLADLALAAATPSATPGSPEMPGDLPEPKRDPCLLYTSPSPRD